MCPFFVFGGIFLHILLFHCPLMFLTFPYKRLVLGTIYEERSNLMVNGIFGDFMGEYDMKGIREYSKGNVAPQGSCLIESWMPQKGLQPTTPKGCCDCCFCDEHSRKTAGI